MSPEEIRVILRIENLDAAADALEMELFEIKKSILSKPLLRLALKSKFARLSQLAKIEQSLELNQGDESVSFHFDLVTSDEVLVLWEAYMKAKSQWKMAFTQTQSAERVAAILEEGLKMELAFAGQFQELNWIDDEPVFGIEPDPMLIQNGLKQALQSGLKTFADLEKNKEQLQKDLSLAIKRLSLLPKYL